MILLESFFVIAMSIFNIILNKFNWIETVNVTSQIFSVFEKITNNSSDF